jgi:DNA-directed RNA polymerase I, II, and III subunit RPABC5
MIIPIRCFTCGKVIANKYEYYKREVKKLNEAAGAGTAEGAGDDKTLAYFSENHQKAILDHLELAQCCRRHMLGQVDLVDII